MNYAPNPIGIVVGGFQRSAGGGLEDAVAGTLRIALSKEVKSETSVENFIYINNYDDSNES
jgi:hypothetical protein